MGKGGGEKNLLPLIYFLAVLSVIILVHELGHFAVAKRLKVRVERFSLGFGPRIFAVKRGETEYCISLIPMGGYVKMAGDEPGGALKGEKWEFLSRGILDRFKIISAGPLLNYILAFLIFSIIFMFGSPTLTTEVGGLLKDHPAERSGILINDKIVAVDGKVVRHWEDMTSLIHKHTEGPIKLSIERSGRSFQLEIRPSVREMKDIFGKKTRIALIGIMPSQRIDKVRYGFLASFYMGLKKLTALTLVTYKAIFALLIGRLSLKDSVTGPIGIFMITGKAAELGFIYILHLMGILSASLAIFNLLPFPVLDGGHIIFLALEKIRGRPLSVKTQEFITNFGIACLILLTLFVFYSDVMKFGILEKAVSVFKR